MVQNQNGSVLDKTNKENLGNNVQPRDPNWKQKLLKFLDSFLSSVPCDSCKFVVIEYDNHDLTKYYDTTQSEELDCFVSPGFLSKHICDGLLNVLYCTPGFITAFRILSPQYQPAFDAPSRTMSEALPHGRAVSQVWRGDRISQIRYHAL